MNTDPTRKTQEKTLTEPSELISSWEMAGKKKKLFLGVLLTLLSLLGVAVTLPFVLDVNRFKGPLLKKVESTINGRVGLGHISFKLFPFIGLALEDLSVQNLPDSPFAKVPLLKLARLDFRIQLKSLLERKIIANLTLHAPEINFIKSAHGSNLDALLKKEASSDKNPLASLAGLFTQVVVQKIVLQDGRITSEDRAAGSPPLKIAGLRLTVDNIVLTNPLQPIGIDLGCRLLDAPKENVSFKGSLSIDPQVKKVRLDHGKIVLADIPPSEGTLQVNLEGSGPLDHPERLTLSGSFSSEKIKYEKWVLTDLAGDLSYKDLVANLKNFVFNLWGGHFAGSGEGHMSGEKPSWDISLKVSDLNMNTALSETTSLSGILTGAGGADMKLKGEGSTPPEIKKSLTGSGSLTLANGSFTPVNIANGIFSKGLLNALQAAGLTPDPLKDLLSEGGTKFGNLLSSFAIDHGNISLPALKLSQADHLMELEGSLNLDLALNLKGKYLLSKERTDSWLQNSQFRPILTDNQGRFVVPFLMTGALTHPSIEPDASYVQNIAAKAVTSLAKQQVEQHLNEAVKKAAPDIKKQLEGLFK